MVQMLMKAKYKNAKVYVRVMPLEKMCWDYIKILNDNKTVYVRALQDFEKGYENRVPHYWNFHTDGVLYNFTQEDIYKTVVNEDFLNQVLDGNDAIILAYGQTGSGKSLTINGMHCPYQERGIAPRLISHLFETKRSHFTDNNMIIKMSYIETEKFYAFDLLNERENLLDSFTIKNVTSLMVDNEDDAFKALFRAEGRRDINEENKYSSNNRNGVLTFEIITKDKLRGNKSSRIHLVDLAGADNFGNFTCFFKKIMEVGHANLAKTQLEQFLLILCENIYERIVVKQRLNILIAYLKCSLNTNSLLRFIGHIRTDFDNLKLTLSVLRFSRIILGLKYAKPLPDMERVDEKIPETVQTKLDQIETERILERMFNSNDMNCLSTNVDQERVAHIRNFMVDYIHDKVNVVIPLTMAEYSVVLEVCKNRYHRLLGEKEAIFQMAYDKALADIKNEKSKREQRLKAPSATSKKERSKQSVTSATKLKNAVTSMSHLPQPEKDHQSVASFKKQSSVRSLKRTSSSKKPSITSETGAGDVTNHDQREKEIHIPEPIPMYNDAWTLFMINENYNYEKLMEDMKTIEEEVKNTHKQYLTEINNLKIVNEMVLIRKNELQKVELRKDLRESIDSEFVDEVNERLTVAQKSFVKQQEQVLRWQAELRIVLNTLQEVKRDLNKEFDRFCMDKYKTYIPKIDIEAITSTAKEVLEEEKEETVQNEDDEIPVICSDKIAAINAYIDLQNLMRKEANEKKLRYNKHKKWINTIKIH